MADEPTVKDILDALKMMEAHFNERVDGVETRIDRLELKLGQRMDDLEERMDQRFDGVHAEIKNLDSRLFRLERGRPTVQEAAE